ncbi:MAG: PIN domain-containing protein [archaeon]
MTDTSIFLDSSIWLGYFLGNIEKTKEIIESEETILFTSIISIHEVFKRLNKQKQNSWKAVKFIEENSIIVNLNKNIAITAVKNCEKYKLHTTDSLIYSSSEEMKTIFITADNDFKKTHNTIIIKTK